MRVLLQKIKGSEKFNVVTIATMRNSPKSVEKFFNKMSIDNLTKYQDPKGKLARSLKIAGLPLTILLNKDNQEVARFIGDADWSSPNSPEHGSDETQKNGETSDSVNHG